MEDIEKFLHHLGAGGKKGWQVHQAREALRIFFQDVEPRIWARDWPEDLANTALSRDIEDREAGDLGRRPGGVERFAGRSDDGECPAKYRVFLEQVEEALRVERYSYRTERTY